MAFEAGGILPFQCDQNWRAVLGEEAGRYDTLHCIIKHKTCCKLPPSQFASSAKLDSNIFKYCVQWWIMVGGLCKTKVGLDRPRHLRLGREEGNGSSQM